MKKKILTCVIFINAPVCINKASRSVLYTKNVRITDLV